MLTRFVRIQLAIFTVVSIVGMAAMAFGYVQLPTLLGLGRVEVKLELPTSGGLYRFSNVTYRGVEVGKVTDLRITKDGAVATMSLARSPRIPADLDADVRSVSAVGEQYVDLRPRTDSGPYLENGSVITADHISLPPAVGPVLDRVSNLVATFPKDRLGDLLDETYKGFNGAGFDFGSLLDSGATISNDLNGIADETRALADDARPLLEGQAATADAIRTWSRSLAGFTGQLQADDQQFRNLLQRFPSFSDETSGLLNELKPTLPVLLANLGTVSEILMTYNASLEQLLVILPPYIAQQLSYVPTADSTGTPRGDFAATVSDPPACTVGFLPPSSWRSPADESDIDTPDGIYCKLPQDSPISVRGLRNFPCIRHPGKRAPTIQICNSDKNFEPLAMRQNATGPQAFDPSLIAGGVPPDDRATLSDDIFGPLGGTPLPPGAAPSGTPPGAPLPPSGQPMSPLDAPLATAVPPASVPPADASTLPPGQGPLGLQSGPLPGPPPELAPAQGPAPGPMPAPPPGSAPLVGDPVAPVPGLPGAAPATPSAFGSDAPSDKPKVAFAQYNPRTGQYMGSDGKLYKVTNLVAGHSLDRTWKDMLPLS